jgi:hypothetical protein
MLHSDLPLDIIHHILLYTGVVKFRNGMYIGQIPATDIRYKILESIPRYKLYDFEDNIYGLFVWVKQSSRSYSLYPDRRHINKTVRFINITVDFENNTIEYCYHNLLHSEGKATNVKYSICIR